MSIKLIISDILDRMVASSKFQLNTDAAFEKANSYELIDECFVTLKFKNFLKLKGRKYRVDPKMFIPGWLVCTANLMGMSKVSEFYHICMLYQHPCRWRFSMDSLFAQICMLY